MCSFSHSLPSLSPSFSQTRKEKRRLPKTSYLVHRANCNPFKNTGNSTHRNAKWNRLRPHQVLEPNNWKTVLELNRVKNLPRQIPRWRLSNRVEIKELSIPLATSMLWTIWWSLHWSKIPGLTSLNQRPKSQANTLFKCFTKRSIFPFTAEFFYFPLILHLDFLNAENEGIMSLEFLQLINNPKTFPSPFSNIQ